MNYKELDEKLQLIPFSFLDSFEELFKNNLDLCNKFLHDCFRIDYDLDKSFIKYRKSMTDSPNSVFFMISFVDDDFFDEKHDINKIFTAEVYSDKIDNEKGKILRVYMDTENWGGAIRATRLDRKGDETEVPVVIQAICLNECNIMYERGVRDKDTVWFSLLTVNTFEKLYERAIQVLSKEETDRLMATAISISKNEDIKNRYIRYLTD